MAALSHCCFNHPWPLEGALHPARWPWIGLDKTAEGKADITQMWTGNPSWVRAAGNSVGTAVLWCSHTHSGALLLHLIYCEGPTPFSAWCCHLWAERGVSFRRHLVTAEPANQNGHRVVQLRIGLKNWFPLEEFLFYFILFFAVCCGM